MSSCLLAVVGFIQDRISRFEICGEVSHFSKFVTIIWTWFLGFLFTLNNPSKLVYSSRNPNLGVSDRSTSLLKFVEH